MNALRRHRERRWRSNDFRLICPCQEHARRAQSPWRRAVRVAARSVAVLMSVPVALALFDVPLEAMNVNLSSLRLEKFEGARVDSQTNEQRAIRIFTTPATREQFISSTEVQRAVTLDAFKEEFFRANIPYGEIIYREAKKNRLSPELVAAMVHTESDFRVGLVSHKSAQGLMQIVPDTARKLGLRNVFDPEQNIAAGTRYYRSLLNRFDNERLALAAYNAGPTTVARFGGVPPFSETEAYIEKVNRRAGRYRERVRNEYLASTRLRAD
jgi:soluble lytic murein transglycosylase-like protein